MKALKPIICSFLFVLPCVAAFAYQLPKTNPYLATDLLAITHIDPAATDSLPFGLPRGQFNVDLKKTPQVVGGPVNIMTLTSTSSDYMWGVSSGGVTYIEKNGDNWKEVGRVNVPGVQPTTAEMNRQALGHPFKSMKDVEKSVNDIYKMKGFERLLNGTYCLVDKNNVLYASYNGKYLYAFALKDANKPADGIKILKSLDFSQISQNPKEGIAGVSMTYDGNLIIVGNQSLTVVDRNFEKVLSRIETPEDEFISNSISVDERGGIYVASDKYMYKVVWTGNMLSTDEKDGAWNSPYETGDQPPVVKFGTGTGSTPTLMGFGSEDKLVVMTDGANRMNLVAFWRDEIPADFKQIPGTKSRRIAGQIKVTCGLKPLPRFVQSEQSVVVKDYGAFVVNNIGTKGHPDLLVGVLALGPLLPPPPHGVERFEWDTKKHAWRSVWADPDVVSTSMVPIVSLPSNMALVNGYTKKDGWEVTGLDWDTGEIIHRTIFGQTNYGNGAYAILELLPENTMIFNSIAGPYRIKYAG